MSYKKSQSELKNQYKKSRTGQNLKCNLCGTIFGTLHKIRKDYYACDAHVQIAKMAEEAVNGND